MVKTVFNLIFLIEYETILFALNNLLGTMNTYENWMILKRSNDSKNVIITTGYFMTTTGSNSSELDIFFKTTSNIIKGLVNTKLNNKLKLEGVIYTITCNSSYNERM